MRRPSLTPNRVPCGTNSAGRKEERKIAIKFQVATETTRGTAAAPHDLLAVLFLVVSATIL
jgi:hypothetical protein